MVSPKHVMSETHQRPFSATGLGRFTNPRLLGSTLVPTVG